jgi:hypothetical protein
LIVVLMGICCCCWASWTRWLAEPVTKVVIIMAKVSRRTARFNPGQEGVALRHAWTCCWCYGVPEPLVTIDPIRWRQASSRASARWVHLCSAPYDDALYQMMITGRGQVSCSHSSLSLRIVLGRPPVNTHFYLDCHWNYECVWGRATGKDISHMNNIT